MSRVRARARAFGLVPRPRRSARSSGPRRGVSFVDASLGVMIGLGPMNDTFAVQSVASNVNVYAYGRDGNDTVNVGNDADRLNDIAGVVAFFGESGSADTLNVRGVAESPALVVESARDGNDLSSSVNFEFNYDGRPVPVSLAPATFATATSSGPTRRPACAPSSATGL